MSSTHFEFDITRQPDEVTCGPSCLHAIYRHYGDDLALDDVCNEVKPLAHGGTLEVLLALHALRRGYHATIYTCNLMLFDPTWFAPDGPLIRDRLVAQMRHKRDDVNLQIATRAYLEYLDLGGELRMEDVTLDLLARCVRPGRPVIAGLSATWLYRCARERPIDYAYDDVAGEPLGHFVVLHGIDTQARQVHVADPYRNLPYPDSHHYQVGVDRLIGAILLGIVTYDAKLLIIEPETGSDDA